MQQSTVQLPHPHKKQWHLLQTTGQSKLAFAEPVPRVRRMLGTVGKGELVIRPSSF